MTLQRNVIVMAHVSLLAVLQSFVFFVARCSFDSGIDCDG